MLSCGMGCCALPTDSLRTLAHSVIQNGKRAKTNTFLSIMFASVCQHRPDYALFQRDHSDPRWQIWKLLDLTTIEGILIEGSRRREPVQIETISFCLISSTARIPSPLNEIFHEFKG